MKVKQGANAVNKRSLRRVHSEGNNKSFSKILDTEEQNKGSYGWAKIDGWPWWPAIVVTSASCGMRVPNENYHCVFWLGHNSVSEVNKSKFLDFEKKFNIHSRYNKSKHIKQLKLGILQAIQYHALNIGCDVSGLAENKLWAWAKEGFPLENMKKIRPVKKSLPKNVVENLELIMNKNLKLKKKKKLAAEDKALNNKKTDELSSCSNVEEGNLCQQQESMQQKADLQTSSEDEAELLIEKPTLKPQASREQNENIKLLKKNEITANNLCVSCFSKDDIKDEHPFFEGGLCSPCLVRFKKFIFYSSDHSRKEICCICFYKGDKIRCQNDACQGSVCKSCYKYFDIFQLEENCLICTHSFDDTKLFIQRRTDKLTKIASLFSEVKVKISKKESISVLTVFEKKLEGYYLMEPLKLPISLHILADGDDMIEIWVKKKNRNIIRLKPPEELDLSKLKKDQIDLLIGGYLTSDVPIKTSTDIPYGLKGSGEVFFKFVKFLCELKYTQRESHLFWLFILPSVAPMKLQEIISRFLGTEPVACPGIPRLYWGNIPGLRDISVPKNIITKFDIPAISPMKYHLGESGWINHERIYGLVPVKAGYFSTEKRDPCIKVPDPTTWMGEIEYMMRSLKLIYNSNVNYSYTEICID